jgi:hypothetical protein
VWAEGDDARAQALNEESLAILREIGDCWNLGWTLARFSWWARHTQHCAWARQMAGESLALSRKNGNIVGMISAQGLLRMWPA